MLIVQEVSENGKKAEISREGTKNHVLVKVRVSRVLYTMALEKRGHAIIKLYMFTI